MKSIVPQGYENPLEMDTLAKGTFICSFQNITNYPFGEQYCAFSFFIKGVDNELTSLEPIFVNFYGKKSVGRVGNRNFPLKSWFHQHQYISSLFLIWRLFSFHRSLLTFTPASYLSANKSRKKIKVLHLVHILDWDTILFVDHETIYNISNPLYSKCLNHST